MKTDQRATSFDDLAQMLRCCTESRGANNPYATAIDGFFIMRADHPKLPRHRLFGPALCITVQGAKWATFGNRRYEYRAGQALVITVDMPSCGAVSEASPEKPFLGFIISLNLAVLHEVSEQMPPQTSQITPVDDMAAVCVVDLCSESIDCLRRALHLLDTPEAIPLLYPGIQRELCYWLLAGPGGDKILRKVRSSSNEDRLIAAIHEIKKRFAKPVRVCELAEIAGMSCATFHRQFKAATAMSPLQYQTQLRLLEARRLMLTSDSNVETAAAEVGYESASQFSRAYGRMFGRSPRRDVHALAEMATSSSATSNNNKNATQPH